MIPILYETTTIEFGKDEGLGRLTDCTTCVVKEERNGLFELSAEYPTSGIHYEEIKVGRIIYAKANDKTVQPFRIYEITRPLEGLISIEAEHISYQLNHIPVMPFKATSLLSALNGLKNNSMTDNPFRFVPQKTSQGTKFEVIEPTAIRTLLGGVEGSIIDQFGGGDWEFDNYNVILHDDRGQDIGVVLEYGKNITDLEQEENIQNTYTGIAPFWRSENVVVTLPEKVIYSNNANNFAIKKVKTVDFSMSYDNKPTVAQLRNLANNYMKNNKVGIPRVSIKVDFVPLWQTSEYSDTVPIERVGLCDTVTVKFVNLGINAKARVVSVEYNTLLERYNSIEVGEVSANLAQTIAESSQTVTTVQNKFNEIINQTSEKIKGGLGGHVVIGTNADGQPNEILVMDTDSKATCRNCIRLNSKGIGFSTSGYNGTYKTAWTLDGTFNANFITAGTMMADRIEGGILTLGGKNNGNGMMIVNDDAGVRVGSFDKTGIKANAGTIAGWQITEDGLLRNRGTWQVGMRSFVSNDSEDGVFLWSGKDGGLVWWITAAGNVAGLTLDKGTKIQGDNREWSLIEFIKGVANGTITT